ncbi:hypothetical protein tb265_33680 [Gemmatimonadetes bacterium T265]|nr:hypothetical protein tb265_33680 [Gemmatimonadetes bacterium T265]
MQEQTRRQGAAGVRREEPRAERVVAEEWDEGHVTISPRRQLRRVRHARVSAGGTLRDRSTGAPATTPAWRAEATHPQEVSMPSQRSNQYKVDPGEFSAPTDENPPDAHLHDAQKADYKQTLADERESMIPRRGENPALADLRARRDAARAAEANDRADERADGATSTARASDAERTE